MTSKANPSKNRVAGSFETAGAIALAGGSDGWVSDATNSSQIAQQDGDIDDTALDAFDATTSETSLSVDIAGGEAFVFGSWLAIDTTTTVSLDANSTQTVYVGWDKSTSNDVIVGLPSAFASTASDSDQRIPLWEFETDGSGVVSTSDYRAIGQSLSVSELSVLQSIDTDRTVRIDSGYGTNLSGPVRIDGQLYTDGHTTVTNGPIYGYGGVTGSGSVSVLNDSGDRFEPIDATIDTNTFIAISGWTTDNDSDSYEAYQLERNAAIEIEADEQLTLD